MMKENQIILPVYYGMSNIVFTLVVIFIIALAMQPASATTVTGTFDAPSSITTITYSVTSADPTSMNSAGLHWIYIQNIENSNGIYAMIKNDASNGYAYGNFPIGAGNGASANYVAHLDSNVGPTLFTGTVGYQRKFNDHGTEIAGFQYLTVGSGTPDDAATYNHAVSGLSGSHFIYLNYTSQDVDNCSFFKAAYLYAGLSNGQMTFADSDRPVASDYQLNSESIFSANYTVTSPSGIGVTGTVGKVSNGVRYNSQAYVWNTENTVLANEPSISGNDFTFSVPNDVGIYLGVKDSMGIFHNSSVLFNHATAVYNISITPKTGSTATTFSAVSSASSGIVGSGLSGFTIVCSGANGGACLSNNTDPSFVKRSGTWYQTNGIYNYALSGFPSSINLNFTAPGNYTVQGAYFPTDVTLDGSTASDTVTVSAIGGKKTVTVSIIDFSSGSLISGASVQVLNSAGIWTNTSTSTGIQTYSANQGEYIGVSACATGYLSSSLVYNQIINDYNWPIVLTKSFSVPVGNNTLYVYVKDSSTLKGLESALVVLNDGQTKQTPASGMTTFTVLEGGTYQVSVAKTGFQSLTRTLIVSGSSNAISMELSPLYITTSPTLAPGQTATPTAQATIDTRTNAQKQDSIVNIIYNNGENMVLFCIVLFFIGGLKMMTK